MIYIIKMYWIQTQLTSNKQSDINSKIKIIEHTDRTYNIYEDIITKKLILILLLNVL